MKQVLIIEAQIKKYRLPFYQKLASALHGANIDLQVGYSDPIPVEASKKDTCNLSTDYGIKVRAYWFLHGRILVQPLLRAAMAADFVIIDQGNKFLLNHLLIPLSRMGLHQVAFWGHGANHQISGGRPAEWYRRRTLNWVSWWFAYTSGTARYLISNGVPSWKITAVDNAVDTRKLRNHVLNVSPEDRRAFRRALRIPERAPVGIFCGGLSGTKRIPFLIDAVKAVVAEIPDFHLIVVGDGPQF